MEEKLSELLQEAEAINERYSNADTSAAEAYTALYDVLECIALLLQDQADKKKAVSLWPKFKERVLNRVDRSKADLSDTNAIAYFSICELIERLEQVEGSENEIMLTGGKVVKNADYVLIETARQARLYFDRKLKISLWPG